MKPFESFDIDCKPFSVPKAIHRQHRQGSSQKSCKPISPENPEWRMREAFRNAHRSKGPPVPSDRAAKKSPGFPRSGRDQQ
jgi:hypothetical protein